MGDKLSQISTMASSANGENLVGLKKTEKMMAFEEEFKVFLDVENDDVEMVDEKQVKKEDLIFEIDPE